MSRSAAPRAARARLHPASPARIATPAASSKCSRASTAASRCSRAACAARRRSSPPLLQPFQPLLLSWSGRGEAPQLTGAERAEACAPLPPACLMGAFYLNELLMKLTTRHDPLPQLFDDYHATLVAPARRRAARAAACGSSRSACWRCSATASSSPARPTAASRCAPTGTIISVPAHGLSHDAAGSRRARSPGRSLLGAGARGAERDARRSRTRGGCCRRRSAQCLEGRGRWRRARWPGRWYGKRWRDERGSALRWASTSITSRRCARRAARAIPTRCTPR